VGGVVLIEEFGDRTLDHPGVTVKVWKLGLEDKRGANDDVGREK
jgi:hypothetical protein